MVRKPSFRHTRLLTGVRSAKSYRAPKAYYGAARRTGSSSELRGPYAGALFVSLLVCFVVLVLVYKNTLSESGLLSSAGYRITDINAILFLVVLLSAGVSFFIAFLLDLSNRRKIKERLTGLASQEHGIFADAGSVTAREFLNISSSTLKENEFTGIYILHNERKDKYYIGQSVRTLDRIRQHLTGHGNGDVYADFKYGDPFTVRTIPLANSGYQSLNDLEREAIEAYGAYTHGYNGTRGNSR